MSEERHIIALTEKELSLVKKYKDGYRGVYWSDKDIILCVIDEIRELLSKAAKSNFEAIEYNYVENLVRLASDKERVVELLEHILEESDPDYGVTWESMRSNVKFSCYPCPTGKI